MSVRRHVRARAPAKPILAFGTPSKGVLEETRTPSARNHIYSAKYDTMYITCGGGGGIATFSSTTHTIGIAHTYSLKGVWVVLVGGSEHATKCKTPVF